MDNPITRQEFREESDKIYSKLNKHDRQITVLETLVENFKGLPSAITKLEQTMALMGQNLESLNKNVDKIIQTEEERKSEQDENDRKQEKMLDEINEKSKVDILLMLKNNWWKIIVVAVAIVIVLQDKIVL